MTDEVAALVLRDNYRQNRALDNATAQATEMEDVHARFMRALEQQRAPRPRRSSASPTTRQLADRRNAGLGLTVPELAVLLAYAKITLEEELLASPAARRPRLHARARARFPTAVRERFLDRIRNAHAAPRDHRRPRS